MPRNPISFGLKQKLASISASQAQYHQSSAHPAPPDSAGYSKRKGVFRRAKRESDGFVFVKDEDLGRLSEDEYGHDDDLDPQEERELEVVRRVICQAGVDFETRPMVVITAASLPDTREMSYDVLLARVLSYLDLYVESDYTVVFLAGGGRNTPGWSWIWKAYRSLNRKYRKNLKKLYIVHSTWFSKMLFSLAGAIISPKFFRKIHYIPTLSALAQQVPIAQIDIAPAVYQENLKYEAQITVPPAQQSNVFGVPLDQLMGGHGEASGIPRVIKDCVEYIREKGMDVEGLFRRSPNSVLLGQVKDAYDRGQSVSLTSFGDVHMAAVLLKKFFRDLPEPIIPERLYPTIRKCPPPTSDPQDMDAVMYIRDTLIPELETESPAAVILLSYVLHLLHEVSLRSSRNMMDAANLAIVFCPNLVSSGDVMRDVQLCKVPGVSNNKTLIPLPASPVSPNSPTSPRAPRTTLGSVIRLCIERYFEVFEDMKDRSEAVPARITVEDDEGETQMNDAQSRPQPQIQPQQPELQLPYCQALDQLAQNLEQTHVQ